MPVYSVHGNLKNYCTTKEDQENCKDIIPDAIDQIKDNVAYPDLPITRPIKVLHEKTNQVKNLVEEGRKISVKHTTYSKEDAACAKRDNIDIDDDESVIDQKVAADSKVVVEAPTAAST